MKCGFDILPTNLESVYQEFKSLYQKRFMKFYFAVNIIILISTWIYDLSQQKSSALFVYGFYGLATAIIISNYVLLNKKKGPLDLVLFLSALVSNVIYLESTKLLREGWNKTMMFSSGVLLQFLMISPLLLRLRWTHSVLQCFILGLYFCLRSMDWSENREAEYYPVIILIINCFIISAGTFYIEKFERSVILSMKQYERSLRQYKHLIKEVVPNSIIITEGENIVFSNKECYRLFQTHQKGEIQQKLKEIYINEKHLSCFSELRSQSFLLSGNGRGDSSTHLDTFLEKIISSEANPGERKTLFELLLADTLRGSLDFKNYIGYYSKSDGEQPEYFVNIQMSKVMWEDKEATMVMITEDHLLERLKIMSEQSRYKDKLLATVSHDLRTPLNGIIGIIEFVFDSISDKSAKKSLLLALRSSHLLSYMINDILDLTQISNGSLRLKLVRFPLIECLRDVFKLIKFQAKKKMLECVFDVENLSEEDRRSEFLNDPSRLKQVVLNLLGNALKFTQKGRITISIESQKDSERVVLVKVSDTGSGIKKEDIPRLFRLFGKLETEESRRVNQAGIGLGLAISQSLIKLMNENRSSGEIKVESEWGKGSTFYFNLFSLEKPHLGETRPEFPVLEDPNKVGEEAGDLLPNEILSEMTVPGRAIQNLPSSCVPKCRVLETVSKKNILVVDDDQINIIVLTKYLDSFEDCTYKVAFNGLQAVERVKSSFEAGVLYDLIFMDCNMPVMDGYQASQEILKLFEIKKISPPSIIATTANVSEEDYENCFKAGMSGYISKPFTKRTVRLKIDEYFKRHSDL